MANLESQVAQYKAKIKECKLQLKKHISEYPANEYLHDLMKINENEKGNPIDFIIQTTMEKIQAKLFGKMRKEIKENIALSLNDFHFDIADSTLSNNEKSSSRSNERGKRTSNFTRFTAKRGFSKTNFLGIKPKRSAYNVTEPKSDARALTQQHTYNIEEDFEEYSENFSPKNDKARKVKSTIRLDDKKDTEGNETPSIGANMSKNRSDHYQKIKLIKSKVEDQILELKQLRPSITMTNNVKSVSLSKDIVKLSKKGDVNRSKAKAIRFSSKVSSNLSSEVLSRNDEVTPEAEEEDNSKQTTIKIPLKTIESSSNPEDSKDNMESKTELDKTDDDQPIIQKKDTLKTPLYKEVQARADLKSPSSSYDMRESVSPVVSVHASAKITLNKQDINFERLSDMTRSDAKAENNRRSQSEVDEYNDPELESRKNIGQFLLPTDNKNLNASAISGQSFASGRPKSAQVRKERHELEKGLIGLNLEISKMREEMEKCFHEDHLELNEIKSDHNDLRNFVIEEMNKTREEYHRRFTEFMAHINDILIEYKDSILVIQSYVDNQLVVSRRDRIDINIIIDSLIKKARYHDEISHNFR